MVGMTIVYQFLILDRPGLPSHERYPIQPEGLQWIRITPIRTPGVGQLRLPVTRCGQMAQRAGRQHIREALFQVAMNLVEAACSRLMRLQETGHRGFSYLSSNATTFQPSALDKTCTDHSPCPLIDDGAGT